MYTANKVKMERARSQCQALPGYWALLYSNSEEFLVKLKHLMKTSALQSAWVGVKKVTMDKYMWLNGKTDGMTLSCTFLPT